MIETEVLETPAEMKWLKKENRNSRNLVIVSSRTEFDNSSFISNFKQQPKNYIQDKSCFIDILKSKQ